MRVQSEVGIRVSPTNPRPSVRICVCVLNTQAEQTEISEISASAFCQRLDGQEGHCDQPQSPRIVEECHRGGIM